MTVTTQQTSKAIKLLIGVGALIALVAVIGIVAGSSWGWPSFGLGLAIFIVGRLAKWWFHE